MTLMVGFHTKSCRKVADRRTGSNPVDVHYFGQVAQW